MCSGVSAWSGRLVHGGLRYLEHRDFALVRESLRERERLFRLAPHLVKPRAADHALLRAQPAPGVADPPRHDRLRRALLRQAHRRGTRSSSARPSAALHGDRADGLSGAAVFTDGQVEYAERLCVELAVAAAATAP